MERRLFAFLRSELELTPARWRAMGRIIVACAIATTLIMSLRIPAGGWIILTIFIVSMPNAGASFVRAVQREIGIAVGCFISIVLVIFFHQQPWILIPLIAVVLGTGVYLSRTTVAPTIPILGALTMMLAIGGVGVPAPEGIHDALWRFVGISAGNIIGSLCQALLWPEKPEQLLLENLCASLRASSKRVQQALLPAQDVVTDEHTLQLSEERIMNSLAQWVIWLEDAENRGSKMRYQHDQMVNLIGDVNQIAIASQHIARSCAYLVSHGAIPAFRDGTRNRIEEIQQRCEQYASAIADRNWTLAVDELPALVDSVSETFAREEIERAPSLPGDGRSTQTFEATILSSAVSIAEALDSMPDAVAFIRMETLAQRRKPGDALGSPPAPPSRNPLFERERASFSVRVDSKLDPADVGASAKAALAAMIAYVYLNAIEWPGGTTAVVTAILVSLDNYGAMIQKSVLRVAGAVIGGIASLLIILFIIPNITSLPPFLVATSLVFGLAAWFQTGSSRIAYAGLQIGLIAGLSLVSTHYPSVDLMPFQDRLLGIFTGLAAVLFVNAIFGDIRARVWALGNSAQTLRIMAQGASIGLRGVEPSREQRPAYGFRYEIYRRIAFGYRLLSEAGYEDWFSRDRDKDRQDSIALHGVLDTIRSIQRVIMSLVWNRLEFQKLETAGLPARQALEAVGFNVAKTLRLLANQIEQSQGDASPETNPLAELSRAVREAEMQTSQAAANTALHPDGNVQRLLHAQLGFYQEIEILLTRLADQSRDLSIREDHFSLAAQIRGSKRQTTAPAIRPV